MEQWEFNLRKDLNKLLEEHVRPESKILVPDLVKDVIAIFNNYANNMVTTHNYTLRGLNSWINALYPPKYQQDSMREIEFVTEVAYKLFNFFSRGDDVVRVMRKEIG